MKVAEVTYVGRNRRHSRRGPSGERYSWLKRTSDVPDDTEEVTEVQDALAFDDVGVLSVEWTPLGELAKHTEGPADEAAAALAQMGYRAKQQVAKSLGVRADGTEEELEERLQPEVERLADTMEDISA